MKCNKCEQEATYNSPEPLCDNHWFDWWTEGYIEDGICSTEELEEMRQEHLRGLLNLGLNDDLKCS